MDFVIILFLIAIVYNLGHALYFLMRQPNSENMARALTWRIGLSLALFVLLMIGFFTGYVHPHGLIS
jgi:hypothetical protein